MQEFEIADHDTEERKEASEIVNKALMALDPKFQNNCDNENAAGVFHKRNCRNTRSAFGNCSFKVIQSTGTIKKIF